MRGRLHPARSIPIAAVLAAAIAAAGCGTKGIEVSDDEPDHAGAVLFAERCSGCHTLSAAGTEGSGTRAVRAQGPNLDQRTETYEDALYAIRNGGFSGAIMPQNIVVGDDAVAVAQFVSKYAGSQKTDAPAPSSGAASGGAP